MAERRADPESPGDHDAPVATARGPGPVGLALKRAVDLTGALVGLLLLSPALAVAAAAILLTGGGPVLFRHTRAGLHGEPFVLFKLRTMRPPRRAERRYDSDALRLTRLGRFLRRWSVDEIPQLVNVVRGEMSLVGPRPLLPEYLERYTPEQMRRHDMKPGLTGWAVVRGRQQLRFSERLALDVWYVDNWSPWLDLRILARTAGLVLTGRGVVSGQSLDDVDDLGLAEKARGGSEPRGGAGS